MSLLDQLYSLCPSKSIVYSSLDEQTLSKLPFCSLLLQQPNQNSIKTQQSTVKQQFLSLNAMIASNQMHRTKLTKQSKVSNQHTFKRQQGIYKISSFMNKKLWKFYYQFFIICQKVNQESSQNQQPQNKQSQNQLSNIQITAKSSQNRIKQSLINGIMILESSLEIIMAKKYNSKFKQFCFNKILRASQQRQKISIFFDRVSEVFEQRQLDSKFNVFQRLRKQIQIQKTEQQRIIKVIQSQQRQAELQRKKEELLLRQLKQIQTKNAILIQLELLTPEIPSKKIEDYPLNKLQHNNQQNIPKRCVKLYQTGLPLQIQDINDNINLFIEISKQLSSKFNLSIGTTNANNSIVTNHLSDQSNCLQKKGQGSQRIFNDEQSQIPKSESQYSETSSKNQILNNLNNQFNQATNQLHGKLVMHKKVKQQQTNFRSTNSNYVSPIASGKNANQEHARTAQFGFKKHHIESILRKNIEQNRSQSKSNMKQRQKSGKGQKNYLTKQIQEIELHDFHVPMQDCSSNQLDFECQPVKLKQIKNSKRMIQQIANDFQISPQKASRTARKDRESNHESQNINKSKCSRDVSVSSKGNRKKNLVAKLRGSITPINICSKLNKTKSKSQIKLTHNGNTEFAKKQMQQPKKRSQSKIQLSSKPIISLRLKHRQSNVSKTSIQQVRKSHNDSNKKFHSQRNQQHETQKLKKLIEIQMINPIKSAKGKSTKSKVTAHILSNIKSKTPKDSSQPINILNNGFQSSNRNQNKKIKFLSLLQ